ncbi:MAG: TlpA family protein disulfide reductase [Deltaproteobacteria bacterium]|nr:TlpA family protein disulfide reductase [Deltaproteobacteria bacterium]
MNDRTAIQLIKILVVVGVLGIGTAIFFGRGGALGSQAPPTTSLAGIQRIDGVSEPLPIGQGKPAFVNVWATWCGPCLQELPSLVEASKAYQGRVAFVGLATDSTIDDVKKIIERFSIPYPMALADDAASASWGVQALPTSFVVDGAGTIVWSHSGSLTRAELDDGLKRLDPDSP